MNQATRIGNSKTVVVLLGWLGAQPKSLRRYEALYRTLLEPPTTTAIIQTYIAPPFTIVQSVLEKPIDEAIRVPLHWPQLPHSHGRDNIRTVQDLAWNILQDIHYHMHPVAAASNGDNNNSSNDNHNNHIYIHAFSNGGCFVWEKISQILISLDRIVVDEENHMHDKKADKLHRNDPDRIALVASTMMTPIQRGILLSIRQQLRGVVFDSCPIGDLHRLPEALQYCTIWERIQVIRTCHYNYLTINTDPQVNEQVKDRITRYITRLQNDPFDMKQLYLYSRDDPLAPASFIDDMIQNRRRRCHNADDETIMACVWEKSQHCGHYIHHPQEYTHAIQTFLTLHKRRNDDINSNRTKNYQHDILRSKL